MRTVLRLPNGAFARLRNHLLPRHSIREEAAFLYLRPHISADRLLLEYVDDETLSPDDFETQASDYLELTDATRARLIKRAHELDACLGEMHSHPGPSPAAFSLADRVGLAETVPHMFWRLKNRPYLAIVVAPSGFDALLWTDNSRTPIALTGIIADDQLLRPTNHSLRGW